MGADFCNTAPKTENVHIIMHWWTCVSTLLCKCENIKVHGATSIQQRLHPALLLSTPCPGEREDRGPGGEGRKLPMGYLGKGLLRKGMWHGFQRKCDVGLLTWFLVWGKPGVNLAGKYCSWTSHPLFSHPDKWMFFTKDHSCRYASAHPWNCTLKEDFTISS